MVFDSEEAEFLESECARNPNFRKYMATERRKLGPGQDWLCEKSCDTNDPCLIFLDEEELARAVNAWSRIYSCTGVMCIPPESARQALRLLG